MMNVLLLTEEAEDSVLFTKALAELSSTHRLVACESVGEFWENLNLGESALPNIIFVDQQLSESYDHELVHLLKEIPELSLAPIVVFADSADSDKLNSAYGTQISCFVVLPASPILRQAKIHACLEFWTIHAILPELDRWWPRFAK